jgi:hypothetical protein
MGQAHGKPGAHIDMLRRASSKSLETATVELRRLKDRVAELEAPLSGGGTGFAAEFAALEKRSLQQRAKEGFREAKRVPNAPLNRYNDVWPNDAHRVTISTNDEETDCKCARCAVVRLRQHDFSASFVSSFRYQRQFCGLFDSRKCLHHDTSMFAIPTYSILLLQPPKLNKIAHRDPLVIP